MLFVTVEKGVGLPFVRSRGAKKRGREKGIGLLCEKGVGLFFVTVDEAASGLLQIPPCREGIARK